MDIKKFTAQVIAGVLLFIIISVILEGVYTYDIWVEKTKWALIFGLVYGMFIWIREKNKK